MAKLPRGRTAERAAVNATRTFFEHHGFVVQEIDGANDLGEDLYLDFTEGGVRTGDTVRVQVKGGLSYRAGSGYRVRIGSHESDWADGNVPVLCIVHDPERNTLSWANATEQIRAARRRRDTIRTVLVPEGAVLDGSSCEAFAQSVRHYVSRYRGNRAIEALLGEMAGLVIGPRDWVGHYRNVHGEDLVFVQRPDDVFAMLLHSDLDWEVQEVTPGMLRIDGLREYAEARGHDPNSVTMMGFANTPVIGELILEAAEAAWLVACFGASTWLRADAVDSYEKRTRVEVDEQSGFPVVRVGRPTSSDEVEAVLDEL